MNLQMDDSYGIGYKSNSQRIRKITEAWAAKNLYCVACTANFVTQAPNNTKAFDFKCESCENKYQLKSTSRIGNIINDAAYSAMIEAIRSDNVPNLVVLNYNPTMIVENLLLVPSFFFTESCILKRSPLSKNAKRSDWVGCNISLSAIAPLGKIWMVHQNNISQREEIRNHYRKIKPIEKIKTNVRGWALDVLNAVYKMNKKQFTLGEIYEYEKELSDLHPENRFVKDKIRQQLQKLRDMNFIEFLERGVYRIKEK